MRLWSLDPALLDRAALVACWREGLLAQKVLAGLTRGYTRHPQLERFRGTDDPAGAIGHFLGSIQDEATRRGYRFDRSRITVDASPSPRIAVTDGQLAYERDWLASKVAVRAPEWATVLDATPTAGPSFVVVPGPIEAWERPA